MYKYSGKTPVDVRDRVIMIDDDANEAIGRVRVLMATQMLVYVPKQGDRFVFYQDQGLTWKKIEKTDQG